MEIEKFNTEIHTLNSFFKTYCQDNHQGQENTKFNLVYKNTPFTLDIPLCKQCCEDIQYSFEKLKLCPHEEKPRCRKCPNPCYEKPKWKNLAKIMRYSAVKLNFIDIKKRVKNLFTS
ncbi:nitrous oxide-stimulated promoter family protein [Arcobacter sp. YIC-464]|uniref:nitrous oxide-stimulated promoter family protein n=1 Tax=Arcobacter sp. YIC-464 TaxID=3376631 RepID=UPI003C2009C6